MLQWALYVHPGYPDVEGTTSGQGAPGRADYSKGGRRGLAVRGRRPNRNARIRASSLGCGV